MLNRAAYECFRQAAGGAAPPGISPHRLAGAEVIDAGIDSSGSLAAGLWLARLCLGGAAEVSLCPAAPGHLPVGLEVNVWTDHPVSACLGAQYAGWPVQTDGYFAMGSGPMRMLRGREPMLEELALRESGGPAVGVLESDRLPDEAVIREIADACGVEAEGVALAVAPSTSLAGSVQVVARSVETAMHKLHAVGFPVTSVVSGHGVAPLPPPAKPGDTIGGIGRTNDAILYGGRVSLWVDVDDQAVEAVCEAVPSCSSPDHGRPFAEIFRDYDHDFYKVDPLLFSPAIVTLYNLRTGRRWTHGRIETDVLKRSFG